MAYQIEIQYNGVYQLDADTRIENPLVIGASANDDLIDAVYVNCYFVGETYYLSRPIGSFNYGNSGWDNSDITTLINSYMESVKI